MEEAKALHQLLAMEDIALLEDSSESLGSRFRLTTIQVAKGMEFDEVNHLNATDEAYHTAKEQMMLYTTCTRAKHRLSLIVPKGQKRSLYSDVTGADETRRTVEFWRIYTRIEL